MQTLEIIRAVLPATIQDLGRPGYRRLGMPVSGAMDAEAMQVANLLVGNARGDAVVEIAQGGLALRALQDVGVAIAGADLDARVLWAGEATPAPMWKSFFLRIGQELVFERPLRGAWAYLAVAGGVDVPIVMGSRSTYLRAQVGGMQGRALAKGDAISVASERGMGVSPMCSTGVPPVSEGRFRGGTPLAHAGKSQTRCGEMPLPLFRSRALAASEIPQYSQSVTARVILGPQAEAFAPEALEALTSQEFEVTLQSDRMGYRLAGPGLRHRNSADIPSDALATGSIQVPADGAPIVLMADHQTTGGYAKIATVISADLSRVAQLRPGGKLRFQTVTVQEAQSLAAERERFFKRLRLACQR